MVMYHTLGLWIYEFVAASTPITWFFSPSNDTLHLVLYFWVQHSGSIFRRGKLKLECGIRPFRRTARLSVCLRRHFRQYCGVKWVGRAPTAVVQFMIGIYFDVLWWLRHMNRWHSASTSSTVVVCNLYLNPQALRTSIDRSRWRWKTSCDHTQ